MPALALMLVFYLYPDLQGALDECHGAAARDGQFRAAGDQRVDPQNAADAPRASASVTTLITLLSRLHGVLHAGPCR